MIIVLDNFKNAKRCPTAAALEATVSHEIQLHNLMMVMMMRKRMIMVRKKITKRRMMIKKRMMMRRILMQGSH